MLSRSVLPRASTHLSNAFPTSTLTLLRVPLLQPPHNLRRLLTTTPIYLSTPMAAPTDTSAASVANTSGITTDSLTTTLKTKLSATHVEIHDMSGGCGQAFNALIVSPEFEKKPLLARHRLVNSALKEEIAAIHAWTPRCLTPEQWEKEKENATRE